MNLYYSYELPNADELSILVRANIKKDIFALHSKNLREDCVIFHFLDLTSAHNEIRDSREINFDIFGDIITTCYVLNIYLW